MHFLNFVFKQQFLKCKFTMVLLCVCVFPVRCALKISCDLKSIATWEVDGIGLATGVLVSMYLLFAFPVTSVLCILNWFDIPLLSLVSKLYEICAANHWKPPVFECCKEEGPCHCRMTLKLATPT
ncbi:uncharacterized protein LOC131634978 isoform X2 [Vicia villosa]|nr:uncharacterized protein LOC131634978 isoform X2 [Vicia villosa]